MKPSTVLFSLVTLNQGGGYNTSTGRFTVPSDGAGIYYLSANFQIDDRKYGSFKMWNNGSVICGMFVDEEAGILY